MATGRPMDEYRLLLTGSQIRVKAYTRGEARAEFKRELGGPLPPRSRIVKVPAKQEAGAA